MTTDKYTKTCTAVLRGVQFGWNEYEGRKQEQLVGRFEMLDGEDAGKFETWFGSLSEDTNTKGKPFVDFTIEALRGCGWTSDDFAELPALVESGQLANEVQVVREFRWKPDDKSEAGGVWRSSVKYINTGGGAKVDLKENAMAPADIAAFARRMKARLGGKPSNGSTQRTAAPPARNASPPSNRRAAPPARGYDDRDPPPPDDDSIPF